MRKRTRLERQMAQQIVRQHAQEWMTERSFRPMTEQEIAEAKARDPEPQPTDGPDYHADHAFWKERQRG